MYYEEEVINGILLTLVNLTGKYLEMKRLYERERKTNNEMRKTIKLTLDLLNEATE